jgi:hypothetical protein
LDILAIDDADIFAAELSSLLREIITETGILVVLIGMRSNRVDRYLNRTVLAGINVREIYLSDLFDDEIVALIAVLEREHRLGKLRGLPLPEQIGVFRQRAERQLLVGLIKANSGELLEDKARKEFTELSGDEKQIYAALVVATYFRFGLSQRDILVAANNPGAEALAKIERLIQIKLIVSKNGLLYIRHRVIAEIVFVLLQSNGFLRPIITGLAILCASQVRQNSAPSDRSRRMLNALMNHDFLYRVIGPKEAEMFYDELEGALTSDPHYWLQRGCLEMEAGNIFRADNYISQAKGLAPSESSIATGYAHLQFQKALLNPKHPDALSLVIEACSTLEGVISTHGTRSPHAYHIYCTQGLIWSRRGLETFEGKRDFLETLRVISRKAIENHPRNAELRQMQIDVEGEYMALAT